MPTKVLIVEDEFLIALEMEETLRDLGFEPSGIADDMTSALEKSSRDIDVALVDVNLADGATGPLIGERLANDYGIMVIFVTANPAQLGEGIDGTLGALEKPVDVAILQEVLAFVIATRRGEAAEPPTRLKLF